MNYISLMNDLQALQTMSRRNRQVKSRTLKQNEKTLERVFESLGMEEYKYLQNAKTDEARNKAIKQASNTLYKKAYREVYKPVSIKRGVKVPNWQKSRLDKLEENFNAHKQDLYEEFLKENPNLSQAEKDFLQGKRVKNVNGATEIQLPISFGKENFKEQIQKDTDLNYFIEKKEKQYRDFQHKIGQYSNQKFDKQLDSWVDSNDMNIDQKELVLAHFNQLSIMQKYNFNQEFETIIQWVESIVNNPKSTLGHYEALMEVVLKQEEYTFKKAGYDL